jgi:hypothetical protein
MVRPNRATDRECRAVLSHKRALWLLKMPYLLRPLMFGLPWMRCVPMISLLVSLILSVRSYLRSRAALQLELLALSHRPSVAWQ